MPTEQHANVRSSITGAAQELWTWERRCWLGVCQGDEELHDAASCLGATTEEKWYCWTHSYSADHDNARHTLRLVLLSNVNEKRQCSVVQSVNFPKNIGLFHWRNLMCTPLRRCRICHWCRHCCWSHSGHYCFKYNATARVGLLANGWEACLGEGFCFRTLKQWQVHTCLPCYISMCHQLTGSCLASTRRECISHSQYTTTVGPKLGVTKAWYRGFSTVSTVSFFFFS